MSAEGNKKIQLTKGEAGALRARQNIIGETAFRLEMFQNETSIFLSALFRKYSITPGKDFDYSLTEDGMIEIVEKKAESKIVAPEEKKIVTP